MLAPGQSITTTFSTTIINIFATILFMPESLLHLDQQLFHFINKGLSNPFFDWIMPYMRYPQFWIPVYVFIFIFCVWRYKKSGVVIILLLLATFAIADFGSAGIVKPLVQRTRPCNNPAMAQLMVSRVPCGTGYSFPSSHAANHMAISVFLISVFQRRWRAIWFWALAWALVVCFAQIYVGVHYPVDIFCGAVYGALVGWLLSLLNKRLQPAF